jgi:UDP-N-acetylglucosamine--N-acetylmuramyl-(pentapeptide) pyrophosphoryl-undecaprenol N-acetylglucosamine transferase
MAGTSEKVGFGNRQAVRCGIFVAKNKSRRIQLLDWNRMRESDFSIAIACGGTGGHLFPGLSVAEKLLKRNCTVTLLISLKEVDQEAVKSAAGMEIVTLPAIGLQRGSEIAFLRGFKKSYGAARRLFKTSQPDAVLAMGGFTSAPPILAGKRLGAQTFLHESNTIPGRANRWLSWVVNHAFVGFQSAAGRLNNRKITITGTPVRASFKPRETATCRAQLGFDPQRPLLVVIGGSQGASGINDLVLKSLPTLAKLAPNLQWFHLAGPKDAEKVKQAYESLKVKAIVHSFFSGMELALGAASAAISRAGASSLAELAAMRVPALLVPYPAATDDHQLHNARAFAETGAARILEQGGATAEAMAENIIDIVNSATTRQKMQSALARWQSPRAAEEIAEAILESVSVRRNTKRFNRSVRLDDLNGLKEQERQEETIVGHA